MIDALKVMILEDRPADQELVKRQVLKYEPKSIFLIAEDKNTFLEKIDWFMPHLILSDYNLPDYTGLDAYAYLKENKPNIPFIFVTGGLPPEDVFAQSILNVADGYVLKDDLSSLHIKLREIIDDLNINFKKNAKSVSRNYGMKVKVIKAVNTLKRTVPFDQKEEVLQILKSLMDQISEKD